MKTKTPKTGDETPNELVIRWLVEMDSYLWANALKTMEAAKLAAEDGLAVQPRRLGRLARGYKRGPGLDPVPGHCQWWRVERVPRLQWGRLLNGLEWMKRLEWVKNHTRYFTSLGTLNGITRFARYMGVRCSPYTMIEAMNLRAVIPPQGRPRPDVGVIVTSRPPKGGA